MSVLITTQVSLDAAKSAGQVVLHISVGDVDTRRLRMVPVSGGRPVDLSTASQAKVQAKGKNGGTSLLLNCTLGGDYADLTPTAALVKTAEEYAAQLTILDAGGNTLHTAPFTIIVHGTVYEGDAVEHTNTTLGAAYFDSNGRLNLVLEDGTKIVADKWEHTHPLATATLDGFMSKEDFSALQTLKNRVNQALNTTSSPTFAGLTVGSMTITSDGYIQGARFK